ncbi:MAG TPA: CorA family divalent cation transporter, partial [Acidimicrobiales bacterium]|nr:CorA family divalent cation transporter [Acidimicrobiales bacterium]
MEGHLITVDGEVHQPTVESVQGLLASSTRFWLDVVDPAPEDQVSLLSDTLHLHPLAVEDADHFGQRPKIDTYDDFAMLVVFGLNHSGRLVEVHCFYTDRYLVTIHRDHCPAMQELVGRLEGRAGRSDHVMLLYRVIDHLVDGYFPVL